MKQKKKLSKEEKILQNIEGLLKKLFFCKWFYYVFFAVCAFGIYFMSLRDTMRNTNTWNEKYINYFLIGSLIVFFIFIVLMIFNNNVKKMQIHWLYLTIALILGFTYLFVAPVFSQSDEAHHFIRAYQISKGHLISPYNQAGYSYDTFPESIYDVLYDDEDRFAEYKNYEDAITESQIPLDKDRTVIKDVFMHNYIFLNYIPHALTIKAGSVFNLSPYFLALLARITNMLCCLALVTLGIYLIPFCKKGLMVLFLAPSVVSYFASLSADGIIIASSFLLIALVLRYRHLKTKLSFKHYLLLLIITAFVATCKIAYIPIIGVLLFLPYDCFKSKKERWIYTGSLLALGLIFCVSWICICHVPVTGMNGDTGLFRYVRFGYVFINTMFTQIVEIIKNIFAGNFMYQARVKPLALVPCTYIAIWILTLLSEDVPMKFRFIEKSITIAIIATTIVIVAYAMYTTNTPKEYITVVGIQGRYFVPLCLLVPFLIPNKKINVSLKEILNVALVCNLFVLLNMLSIFVV